MINTFEPKQFKNDIIEIQETIILTRKATILMFFLFTDKVT